jgi:hypothetical protein
MGAAVEDGKSTPGQSEGMIVRPDLHQSTLSVLVRQPEWSGADAFHFTLDPFAVMAAAGRHPPPVQRRSAATSSTPPGPLTAIESLTAIDQISGGQL